MKRDITAKGKTLSLRAWARESGIAHSTIHWRLAHGWTPEAAVSLRPDPKYRLRGERG